MSLECVYSSICEEMALLKIYTIYCSQKRPQKEGNKGDIAELWNKGEYF